MEMASTLTLSEAARPASAGLPAAAAVSLVVASEMLSSSWSTGTPHRAAMRRRKEGSSKSGLPSGSLWVGTSIQKPAD